jgi:FlaG/FlaF family flagellin (archaellin)
MGLKRSNAAVSEVIGTVLLLGAAISLLPTVYLFVWSFPIDFSPPSVDLVGFVEGSDVIIEHHGGDSLSLSTEIVITVGNSTTRITVEDCLNAESKEGEQWDIGERVVYSPVGGITDLQVKVVVVDVKSNSAIMIGVLQEGGAT